MAFPQTRLRRMRATPALRALIRETQLEVGDLVLPLFVRPGKGEKRPIQSMPGHFQYSVDELVKAARSAASAGIPAVMLFGLPERKDPMAKGAYAADGIVQRAVRAIKDRVGKIFVLTDL